ncbi:hypothetical protein CK203_094919 [Vitis vinifera]|uniref:Reverse transcriptase domain-containing protein n=1 Tax=Vitis vinifera TaxID=29760 RepID=A0A438DNA2_VITVI|nr:hypothetical protein CK203_094919 [Vitis vinifera]
MENNEGKDSLFADDTLVFCEESLDQMTYLSWLLMWFEACLGLKINLEKSELIPMGRVQVIKDLALEKVRLRLEKIQRDFLWGGGALVQKPHLVRWNLVCLDKRKGGLGVRNLALMNIALLKEGGWRTQAVSGRYGVGHWKAIRKEWLFLNGRLAYQVGSGQRNAWVSNVWNPIGDGNGWTPLFVRAFNDWEIELVEHFLHKIQVFRVQREEEDKVVWTTPKYGTFSIKSLYSILSPEVLLCSLVIVFGGDDGSPFTSLCKDVGSVESSFLPFWCGLNSLVYSEGNSYWVAWSICGKARKKAWQMAPYVYFGQSGRKGIY